MRKKLTSHSLWTQKNQDKLPIPRVCQICENNFSCAKILFFFKNRTGGHAACCRESDECISNPTRPRARAGGSLGDSSSRGCTSAPFCWYTYMITCVCIYIYVICVCIYIYVYVAHVHFEGVLKQDAPARLSVGMYVCINVYICIYIYIYVRMYIYIYTYIYIYDKFEYMYIYMYVYIYYIYETVYIYIDMYFYCCVNIYI